MSNIEVSRHALATALKSVGVHGLSDSDEESNDSSVSSDSDPHGFIRARKSVTESVTESVDGHNPRKRRKRKGGWKKRTKLPYKSSLFYRDYHDPRVKVSGTPEAKEFRCNYRMPWIRAHYYVELFVRNNWVFNERQNKKLFPGMVVCDGVCPPEIKILGTLYWLGEGCTFRTIYNLSGRVLSRQTFTKFAKKFCRIMRKHLAPEWIKVPADVRELYEVSKPYENKGFPGACGSTDGVQIAWEGCPFCYRHSFTGKEKIPTIGFNVTVAHDMRIMNVCSMFAGRFNDKTKILYDSYVQKLRGDFYDGFHYQTKNSRGEETTWSKPYLICDNGYHRWVQLMCPYKTTSQAHLAVWSKRLESVRKDVERTFGVLKKRFRILKLPLMFREASLIEDIFITCCVLHNMLLHHDRQFADGRFTQGISPTLSRRERRTVLINNVTRLLEAHDDFSHMQHEMMDEDTVVQVDQTFEAMRQGLAHHTYYLYLTNQLIY